ncbi:MAG: hypothetical protein [Cressdnaviricota sp.]|nr:MAG: hypothetical protein [Cressdnaviricota sp.]
MGYLTNVPVLIIVSQCLAIAVVSIGVIHLITMSKRKMCPASQLGASKKPSTGSSVERPVNLEPLISKDTSRYEDGVLSLMYQVSSHLGHISRGQQVLLDRIESIAAKVETLSKEVNSMKAGSEEIKTKSEERSWLPSNLEIQEWLNSPIQSPERGSTMDLTCSEMPFLSTQPLTGLPSMFDGFGDFQEWVKVDMPMTPSLMPMSRSQEPSGGMDISAKKKL